MLRSRTILAAALIAATALLSACATAPRTQSDRDALIGRADLSVRQYRSADPTLRNFFESSHGYAVFPSVGSGGFIVGGGFGRGVVYEQGRAIGFTNITSASVGLQAGGQGFSQIIFFETPQALWDFRIGQLSFSADVTAVAVDSGAAAQTNFRDGVAVFIRSQSGAMAGASVGGQRFSFESF